MYASHYGLAREPFSIAPDPHFLFMSEAHREALAHLLYGVSGGGGFVLLTGEIGAGKTTVCRCFLDQVPAACDVAYVFNPKLSAVELLQTVCDEFRIEVPPGAASIKAYVDALNAFLLRSHAAGRHSVLIIDEAQSLSAEVLEQLRLLTNLETAERKLLQIILIGQPELRTMLARPELEQLAQRVIARYHLPALSAPETVQYVRHRLSVAGLSGEVPFDAAAMKRLHQLCGGVPRRINLLADRALLGGYAVGRTRVGREIVDRAATEVFGSPGSAAAMSWRTATAAALALAVVGAGAWYAWQPAAAPAAVAAAAPAASAVASTPASAVPAAAAASAAPGMAAVASDALATTPVDAEALLARASHSESDALRELLAAWKVPPGDGDPCEAAMHRQVYCLRLNTGLAQLRELGRPGVLALHDGRDRTAWVQLVGLDADEARVAVAGEAVRVPLVVLAGLWRGEFVTAWQAPPPYREPLTAAEAAPLTAWIAERLPADVPGSSLKARLTAFQVAHGLKPDGLAGPMTLIQINRASGIDEPRLQR